MKSEFHEYLLNKGFVKSKILLPGPNGDISLNLFSLEKNKVYIEFLFYSEEMSKLFGKKNIVILTINENFSLKDTITNSIKNPNIQLMFQLEDIKMKEKTLLIRNENGVAELCL